VLGCLQYLLQRLAITKYETNGALVEVTIEVVCHQICQARSISCARFCGKIEFESNDLQTPG
jgi:hypothetical protein